MSKDKYDFTVECIRCYEQESYTKLTGTVAKFNHCGSAFTMNGYDYCRVGGTGNLVAELNFTGYCPCMGNVYKP